MLVIGAIALILRILGVSYEGVCLVTIVFVFIYLGLTDMRPPVIRASVLITTMSLGALIYRQGFLLNSLACAALILLAMNPASFSNLARNSHSLQREHFYGLTRSEDRSQANAGAKSVRNAT